MTNENEVEWWKEEPYMTRGPYSDFYHFEKIVAESMRRGEVKAWREAKEALKAADAGPYIYWVDAEEHIDAKWALLNGFKQE